MVVSEDAARLVTNTKHWRLRLSPRVDPKKSGVKVRSAHNTADCPKKDKKGDSFAIPSLKRNWQWFCGYEKEEVVARDGGLVKEKEE